MPVISDSGTLLDSWIQKLRCMSGSRFAHLSLASAGILKLWCMLGSTLAHLSRDSGPESESPCGAGHEGVVT